MAWFGRKKETLPLPKPILRDPKRHDPIVFEDRDVNERFIRCVTCGWITGVGYVGGKQMDLEEAWGGHLRDVERDESS
jgi:hypothetical protein